MGKSYIYIYIANGAPTILNVDNEADGEALEKLGAIRMPESMATEVFGNNAKYADNTTCVITENPNNAEFPFSVQFDASKIMAKPKTTRKLTDSYLAGIGMLNSAKHIDIQFSYNPESKRYHANFTASANGWAHVFGQANETNASYSSVWLHVGSVFASSNAGAPNVECGVVLPVSKGQSFIAGTQNCKNIKAQFFYAIGEK